MKKTRLVILLPAILTVLLLGSASLPAQTSRIEIGYRVISGDALPAWVVKEAGLLRFLYRRWPT